MRRVRDIAGLLVLVLVLAAGCNGCSFLQKTDGTPTTAIEKAKIVQKAAHDAWKEVQETFAEARVSAEKAEKLGKPLIGSQITFEQWSKFSAIDTKVTKSGRELAQITKAIEVGTSKDAGRMGALTAELFKLFDDTRKLAEAFSLKIPLLPASPAAAPTSALPFLLAGLPLVPMRRRALVPIAGGSDGVSTAVLATSIAGGMIAAAGPAVAALAIKNPEDQKKAEVAAALLGGFLSGLAAKLPAILDGLRNPSSISLDELWTEDAEQVLARVRAEQG